MILVRDMIFGLICAIIGYMACAYIPNARAYDPCDKQDRYDKPSYRYNDKKDEDAAMQFHWQDHQPSLHPR